MKKIFILILIIQISKAYSYTVYEDTAAYNGGYHIPIKILVPDQINGSVPIIFYVHGGGWYGGDATSVPAATVGNDATYLCDELGIIYVGLAYRCKGNNSTHAEAIEDLDSSVAWFFKNSHLYGGDTTQIGFSGASAGSNLSSVMAQRYEQCKTYVGLEGMYNLVDHDSTLSGFPSSDAFVEYGLTQPSEKLFASAFYNLRSTPPSTLLFHGKEDYLCNISQTENFADTITKAGGKVKTVYYDSINHTCMGLAYTKVMKNSIMEIAKHYTEEYQLQNIDLDLFEQKLDIDLSSLYSYDDIPLTKLAAKWSNSTRGTYSFYLDGTGEYLSTGNAEGNEVSFTYTDNDENILININNTTKVFYLRRGNDKIYELYQESARLNYRRYDYFFEEYTHNTPQYDSIYFDFEDDISIFGIIDNYTNEDDHSVTTSYSQNFDLTQSTGKNGMGLSFNGTGNNHFIGQDKFKTSRKELTVSMWLNLNYTNNIQSIIALSDPNSPSIKLRGYLQLKADSTLQAFCYRDDSLFQNSNQISTSKLALDGSWQHVALTLNDDVMKIYIDGALQGSLTAPESFLIDNIETKYSFSYIPVNKPLYGTIDDFYLINRALSDSEITELYDILSPASDNYLTDVSYNIYPNPVNRNDNLIFDFPSNINIQKIELIDLNGLTIYAGNISKLNLSVILSGIYFVKPITQDGRLLTPKKIIITD